MNKDLVIMLYTISKMESPRETQLQVLYQHAPTGDQRLAHVTIPEQGDPVAMMCVALRDLARLIETDIDTYSWPYGVANESASSIHDNE